jgi:DNA-binding NarL/FixJ family response regulator
VALEASGAVLVAAEASAAAGEAWRRAGQPRRGVSSEVYAAELAARCEGARTFGLSRPAEGRPLTTREREIAVSAAAGRSSREIAAQLVLSVRTVDNHLQRIYAKLGVTSRRELADALGSG